MVIRAARYTFYVAIYLSGILIGGIYTPQVIAYVEQPAEQLNVQQNESQPKPSHIKKKRIRTVEIG